MVLVCLIVFYSFFGFELPFLERRCTVLCRRGAHAVGPERQHPCTIGQTPRFVRLLGLRPHRGSAFQGLALSGALPSQGLSLVFNIFVPLKGSALSGLVL